MHVSRLSAMGQMAAALAHELNQPLTAIANYLSGVTAAARRRQSAGAREQAMRSRSRRRLIARGRSSGGCAISWER